MYRHQNLPTDWFTSRPSHYSLPMSRPVSKSFNRISDFIFPDTVHIRFPEQQKLHEGYRRIENYSLPALNRHNERDVIVVERLPANEVHNIDLLYREQSHQPNRQIRRRYSSNIDERRMTSNEKTSTGLMHRSTGYRERVRDRRKRHTTDNVYHSMLKSMLEEDEQPQNSNYILSYRTTLDPITDSESMTSIHEHVNDTSHNRLPINGTLPLITERERTRQRRHSSTISSHDSSSDTDIMERRTNYTHYQQNTSHINSSNNPPTVWERLPPLSSSSNPVRHSHQPDRFIPINTILTDTNNHKTISYSNNHISSSPFDNVSNSHINNQLLSQDATHHVSLCVNDLHTTLFIDENTLNNTNTETHTHKKAVIKTFIDRIIKRLQHFKRSLDNGLTYTKKRNTLVTGAIVTAKYDDQYENKYVRPYFLIHPQAVLVVPNEIAKFKCCFGGDPLPSITWSHNESRIPEIITANGPTSSHYKMHKLHDIYYLDIGPVNLRDNGHIKCTIMNKLGREEATAQLFVVPSSADGTPYITHDLTDVTVTEGHPLTISCSINGLQVAVNWFHNGKLVSSTTQTKANYNNENAIFTMSSCMRTDAGTIDCLVKNRFGEARTSCRIEVIDDPEFDR